MIPVTQTLFGEHIGNCLQACVASILNKPLGEIPHFVLYKENWLNAFILFMRDFNYEFHGIASKETIEQCNGIDGFIIAQGLSPRNLTHVVIFKDGKMIHDPHPSGGGIVLDCYYKFEPFGEIRKPLELIIP